MIGHGTLKMLSGNWNSGRLSGFSPDNFHLKGRIQMLAKCMTAGLVGSALLATVAFAQGPAAPTDSSTMKPADSATMKPAAASDSSFQGTWRGSKLVGLNVYNDNNESLGSISDMLTDKSGNIKGVVIGVGGFLGVGEHLVAVSWDKIKFVDQPVAYTGASNAPTGSRPAPSTTTGAAPTTAPASPAKSNPWYPDHAMLSATKDQLKAMPEFKYSN
jgi:sporulation protein YlmC with PRC-barrel domain